MNDTERGRLLAAADRVQLVSAVPLADFEAVKAYAQHLQATLRSIAAQTACRCGPEWTRYGCHAPGCRFEISLEAMEALGEGTEAKEGEA